eukprot:gene4846-biopygen4763
MGSSSAPSSSSSLSPAAFSASGVSLASPPPASTSSTSSFADFTASHTSVGVITSHSPSDAMTANRSSSVKSYSWMSGVHVTTSLHGRSPIDRVTSSTPFTRQDPQ